MDQTLELSGKQIRLHRTAEGERLPLVLYNGFDDEETNGVLANLSLPCVLAIVTGINWELELTPWPVSGIGKGIHGDGGAGEYLTCIRDSMIPAIEAAAGTDPKRRILAGYSLAGLFAVWASMNTDAFCAVCSASGSLWYPKLLDYAKAKKHPVNPAVRAAYFSVGDLESKVKNQILNKVQENTEEMEKRFAAQNVRTIFEINPGNHYVDAGKRTARGISWCLKECQIGTD